MTYCIKSVKKFCKRFYKLEKNTCIFIIKSMYLKMSNFLFKLEKFFMYYGSTLDQSEPSAWQIESVKHLSEIHRSKKKETICVFCLHKSSSEFVMLVFPVRYYNYKFRIYGKCIIVSKFSCILKYFHIELYFISFDSICLYRWSDSFIFYNLITISKFILTTCNFYTAFPITCHTQVLSEIVLR